MQVLTEKGGFGSTVRLRAPGTSRAQLDELREVGEVGELYPTREYLL